MAINLIVINLNLFYFPSTISWRDRRDSKTQSQSGRRRHVASTFAVETKWKPSLIVIRNHGFSHQVPWPFSDEREPREIQS